MPLKTEVRYIELPTGPFAPVLHVLLLGRDALEARLVVAVAFEKLSARDDIKDEVATFQVEPSVQTHDQPYRAQEQFRFVHQDGCSMGTGSLQYQRTVPQGHHGQLNQSPPQPTDTSYAHQAQRTSMQIQTGVEDQASVNHPIAISSQIPRDQHYGSMTVPSQMQNEFSVTHGPYDYPAWDEPLNWIPISVYPSPYEGELEHDFSFLLPPLSDSSTLGVDYGPAIPIDASSQVYQIPSTVQHHEQPFQDGRNLSVTFSGLANSPTSSASNEQSAPRSGIGSGGLADGKKRRRKSAATLDLFVQPRRKSNTYAFPTEISSAAEDPDFHPRQYCSVGAYDILFAAFERLCRHSQQKAPFHSTSFPDMDAFNRYIDLYFQHFHSIFPLLHRPTFGHNSHWSVILAAATIGSTFAQASYTSSLREAFQEFLRRVVSEASETASDLLDIPLAQARLLNLVSLGHAEADHLRLLATRCHADLSHWCLESGILQLTGSKGQDSDHGLDSSHSWQAWSSWIQNESLRRIAYLTWLMDTSMGYLANTRPLCNMDDARTPLPSEEGLWKAETAEDWRSLAVVSQPMPSLCGALEHLYTKKAVPPGLSDLCQTLVINALFQRTWEVGTHIKQPLSEWVPTGKARGFLNTPSKDDFWLPLYPLYANWRNSACDCLDIINWQAASIVAKASGVEHDLMLHLHLARIILLTPFQEIQDLLFSLIGRVGDSSRASFYVHDGSYQPRNRAKLPQIRKITWRWLRDDQHKARLAMVHAGSVFWHVRRYSSMSFYEPLAVYLASLVLWTYGSYKSAALERNVANANSKPIGGPSGPSADLTVVQPSRVERKIRVQDVISNTESAAAGDRQGSEADAQKGSGADSDLEDSSSDTSGAQPEFIHLDRPCDDEMIQHFVRNGHNMTGHMSNVGDICKTPSKVLLEGAKLLRTRLGCWGVSREYYDILTRLAEMRKG
ncbi:uncharacterized protein HMPREF1541_09469 [Cyphellophora europaea CBS 101466]|uniref:Xylanolytic transcriptional activator regulatory domain-containing protein n=1 Tax=Cyphellophora europaea (strain CBS 101466) TaxID=1220924 RepID=W2SAB3_CYPE1|nr:uncharacterized protein HMPREF1541_09469 [Cyphellophora europaea CBS 101466]ETN45637.1 hypothetical protein HMPREF1541_09469 [Cyphellophora europaea CBS 101466]